MGYECACGLTDTLLKQLRRSNSGRLNHSRRFIRSASGQPESLEARCLLTVATPLISIGDAQVVEGDTGNNRVTLEVKLNAVSEVPVTVTYTLESGSALIGVDIQRATGRLTIPAGSLRGQIVTYTIADTTDEPNETATVRLSSPQGALLSKAVGTITILDDDLPPTVNVANVTVTEGQSAKFTLTLSQVSGLPVTVRYRTVSRTATAATDFTPVFGRIVIPAGATSATIDVQTLQDTVDEPSETFSFLYNTSSVLPNRAALATILDDDPPALTIKDVSVREAEKGVLVQVLVTASSASPTPITATFATRNGTAVAGNDYRAASGLITLPAGSTRAFITLRILDDNLWEATAHFKVVLSNPVNATLARAVGIVHITDNDPMPFASIANAVTTEGDSGDVAVVSLSRVAGSPITISYATSAFTATAGVDFINESGTITIPAGQLTAGIRLRTIEDTRSEPDESFRILLSNSVGATLLNATGIITIKDDDTVKLPLFEPSDMVHLGAFQVPAGQWGSASFGYGGNAITFNRANNSLFMAADVNVGLHVSEVAIPNVLSDGASLIGMPVASVIQPFVNLGRLLTTDASGRAVSPVMNYENLNLGGLIVAGGGLTGGMYMGYTGAEPQFSRNSHFRTNRLSLSALTAADVQGLINIRRNVNAADARIRGGYMAEVPAMWRPYLNATHVTGAAGQNRIQFSSGGPALFGFNAVNPKGTSPAALLSYPSGRALQWSDSFAEGPRTIFNGTTKVDGVAFVPGTRSVIFLGSNGLSNIGYGDGSQFNDRARPYSGYHSQNGVYAYQIWAYDIDDFMAVRNGTKAPWDLRPTSVVNFDLPIVETAKYLGGVAFDAATNRLYVSQKLAGVDATPVIHVYQLGRQTAGTNTISAMNSKTAPVTGSPSTSGRLSGTTTAPAVSSPAFTPVVTSFSVSASASTTAISPATAKVPANAARRLSIASSSSADASFQALSSAQSIDMIFASLAVDLSVLE